MTAPAPLPTALLLGGDAADRAAQAAALDGVCDCIDAVDSAEAWAAMSEHFVQVVICAGIGAGPDCASVFSHLHRHWPETMLIVLSDDGAPGAAEGAPNLQQVLPRQWNPDALRLAVGTATRLFALSRENDRMALEMRCLRVARPAPRKPRDGLGFDGILHMVQSPMSGVVCSARQFASFDIPVMLVGEPGTGKARMAEAIHLSSRRADQPFLTLDCNGLSEGAVLSALFGRRKTEGGTPAGTRAGKVSRADQGTLYLTGLETLPREAQKRVLRLVRDGLFELDGTTPRNSHVRVLSGFAEDPAALVEDGRLDPGLFYALAIGELTLPPLRDRACDIPALAQDAVERAARQHGKSAHGLSEAALDFLGRYAWPGNLNELDNEVTRMLIAAQDPVLGAELISRRILQAAPAQPIETGDAAIMAGEGPLKDRIEAIEARILRETLTRLRWNKSRAAAELGLSRVGLRAKLDRYGLVPQTQTTEDA